MSNYLSIRSLSLHMLMASLVPGLAVAVPVEVETTARAAANDAPAAQPIVMDRGLPAASGGDRAFLDEALVAGRTEVALARLAKTQSADPAIRTFATTLEREHLALNNQMEKLLAGYDPQTAAKQAAAEVPPPHPPVTATQPGASTAQTASTLQEQEALDEEVRQLQQLQGPAFDHAYLAMQSMHHAESIARFERAANAKTGSGKVRDMASNALPKLRAHGATAKQFGDRR